MRRWGRATLNSWKGLRVCFEKEAAFREEVLLLVIAIPTAYLLTAGPWQCLALIASVFLLLIIELLNTAIETLCDKVSPEHDPAIGHVKDMGSAAIGLTLTGTAVVWGFAVAEWIAIRLSH